MKKVKVAILGATGAVGREMMKILAERNFPVEELHLLASGTGEYWIRFGLEITFSVNMEKCDVSDGGIAIRKEEAWFVFRHSLEV